MRLAAVDLAIVGVYVLAIFVLGIALARRAGRSNESFFLAGRRLPWWLAGTSLIATSFSIDTPLGIAGLVESNGIPGVWFAWCFAIGGVGMLGYVLFAELWNRSAVITDAEFVELRYGGRAGAALRGLKGLYFGVFLNALTLAWVLKAVVTLGGQLFGQPPVRILVVVVLLTLVYAAAAGLWGVVVSDLPQYVIVLTAMLFIAWASLGRVGGIGGLEEALAQRWGAERAAASLSFLPSPKEAFFPTFLAYVAVLWWAHKNANASGAVVQRLLSCRDEKHARWANLWFTLGTFALNYWPMILIALCGLALYPELSGEQSFGRLLGEQLPIGARGLVVAALLAAFMSTVDSHLNLGASYLVNDVVKRFVRPRAGERELVLWGRLSTVIILLLALAIMREIDSVASAWTLLAAMTSGYGLVTVLRWFWWRVNAWSEISALIASGLATWGVRSLAGEIGFGHEILLVVLISTPIWLLVTFLTPPTPATVVDAFVRRTRPWGVWGDGRRVSGGLSRRLCLWLAGTVMVLGLDFFLGSLMFERWRLAGCLLAVTAVAAVFFVRLERLVSAPPISTPPH